MEKTPTPTSTRCNRVHWFAGRVHEVLDDVLGTGGGQPAAVVGMLSVEQTEEALRELRSAVARLEGIEAALVAHGDAVDIGAESGATSTKAWLAHATRTTPRRAAATVRTARALTGERTTTQQALLGGSIHTAHAEVIVTAISDLPASVGSEDRARAEAHLLELAATHHADDLKRLAKHLHEVIDPDAADTELGRRVEAEEARAAKKVSLTMWDDGQGCVRGKFVLPTLHGAMLSKAIDALLNPRRPDPINRLQPHHADATDNRMESPAPALLQPKRHDQLQGEAFCDLLERLDTATLPLSGGVNATVVVTMRLETLLEGLGVAQLDTGGHLSGGEARRLACHAGIIPAVLGGKSEVLDLGRKRRFYTKAQRLALALRDGGCTIDGCTRPAGYCHAHHDLGWTRDTGPTDLEHGRLLCPRHHTLVHHPSYRVEKLPHNQLRLVKTTLRRQ